MDETWSSFLSVVAQFIQGGKPKNVQVKDGYCFVPPELEVGAFELCLRGDDGESVVASVNRLPFDVCEGFDPSGETPLPPSPDLYTQLIKEIDSGKKIAQSVREDAYAGRFNGERGADGGWYTPSVTQTDENTLRMDFTPSKGDMPDVAHTDIMLPNVGGGISDHSKLSNRDAADQHPMIAITGLEDALAGKQPKGDYIPNPTTASVGQTIRVAAVDDAGKPTEWEAVEFPAGGGGSGEWELIGEVVSDGAGDATGISIPCDLSGYKQVFVCGYNLTANTQLRILLRKQLVWSSVVASFGYNQLGKESASNSSVHLKGNMNNPWVWTGIALNVAGRVFAYGGAEAKYNGGSAYWRQDPNALPPKTNWSLVKYISLDTNTSDGVVPEGCTLIAWGCK